MSNINLPYNKMVRYSWNGELSLWHISVPNNHLQTWCNLTIKPDLDVEVEPILLDAPNHCPDCFRHIQPYDRELHQRDFFSIAHWNE